MTDAADGIVAYFVIDIVVEHRHLGYFAVAFASLDGLEHHWGQSSHVASFLDAFVVHHGHYVAVDGHGSVVADGDGPVADVVVVRHIA